MARTQHPPLELPFDLRDSTWLLRGVGALVLAAFFAFLGSDAVPSNDPRKRTVTLVIAGVLGVFGVVSLAMTRTARRGSIRFERDGLLVTTSGDKRPKLEEYASLGSGLPVPTHAFLRAGATLADIERARRRLWARSRAQQELEQPELDAIDLLVDNADGWFRPDTLFVPFAVERKKTTMSIVATVEQALVRSYPPGTRLYLTGYGLEETVPTVLAWHAPPDVEVVNLGLLDADPYLDSAYGEAHHGGELAELDSDQSLEALMRVPASDADVAPDDESRAAAESVLAAVPELRAFGAQVVEPRRVFRALAVLLRFRVAFGPGEYGRELGARGMVVINRLSESPSPAIERLLVKDFFAAYRSGLPTASEDDCLAEFLNDEARALLAREPLA